MSFTWTCDWCGREIEPGAPLVKLEQAGSVRDVSGNTAESRLYSTRDVSGWIGHYHGRDCWQQVREGIDLVLAAGPSIDRIPTTSGQKIAALRRRHTRHDDA
jgi:hypothetical protein